MEAVYNAGLLEALVTVYTTSIYTIPLMYADYLNSVQTIPIHSDFPDLCSCPIQYIQVLRYVITVLIHDLKPISLYYSGSRPVIHKFLSHHTV